MKRELIIVSIIVICIIVISFVSQNNTKKQIADIDNQLENFKAEIIENKKSYVELNKEIDKIYDNWVEKDKILSLYLEHNELEKINLSLKTIKGFIEVNIVNEGVQEIEKCIATLDHIEEKQAFNLKNIF